MDTLRQHKQYPFLNTPRCPTFRETQDSPQKKLHAHKCTHSEHIVQSAVPWEARQQIIIRANQKEAYTLLLPASQPARPSGHTYAVCVPLTLPQHAKSICWESLQCTSCHQSNKTKFLYENLFFLFLSKHVSVKTETKIMQTLLPVRTFPHLLPQIFTAFLLHPSSMLLFTDFHPDCPDVYTYYSSPVHVFFPISNCSSHQLIVHSFISRLLIFLITALQIKFLPPSVPTTTYWSICDAAVGPLDSLLQLYVQVFYIISAHKYCFIFSCLYCFPLNPA